MKEYVGFGGIVSSPIVERPNMPIIICRLLYDGICI
jgi:hypothetical protein